MYSKVFLLLVVGLVSSGECGVTIKSPEEFVGFSFGPVTPRTAQLRTQLKLEKNNTKVHIFSNKDYDDFCVGRPLNVYEVKKAQRRFGNTLLLVFPELKNDGNWVRTCFGASSAFRNMSYIAQWCHLGAYFVEVSFFIPGLMYNRRDQIEYKKEFPEIASCHILEVKTHPQLLQFLSRVSGGYDGPPILADVVTDPPSCESIFSHILVFLLVRITIGGIFFVVGLMSAYAMLTNTYTAKQSAPVHLIVLTANLITASLLGMVLMQGGWYLSSGVSGDMNQLCLNMFLGTGTANDILLACTWRNMYDDMRFKIDKHRKTKDMVMVVLALMLISVDWASSIGFIYLNLETLELLTKGLPIFLTITQLVVNVYLALQTVKLVKIVKNFAVYLSTKSAMYPSKLERVVEQRRIVARMTKLLALTVIGSFLGSLCLLVIGTSTFIFDSCFGWLFTWIVVFMSRIMVMASQTVVCTTKSAYSTSKIKDSGDDDEDKESELADLF